MFTSICTLIPNSPFPFGLIWSENPLICSPCKIVNILQASFKRFALPLSNYHGIRDNDCMEILSQMSLTDIAVLPASVVECLIVLGDLLTYGSYAQSIVINAGSYYDV